MLSGLKQNYPNIKMNKIFVSIFALFFSFLLVYYTLFSNFGLHTIKNKKQPLAKSGVIDLAGWDFKSNGNVNLNGEWNFYWNKLLDPSLYNNQAVNDYASMYSKVPGLWKSLVINGNHLPDEGYATYRLLVKLDNIPENLGINAKFFISSCKIWVNEKKVYESGIVSDKAQDFKGKFTPKIISIHPSTKEFYITIQISNFGYANGGFISSVELGDTLTLMDQKNTRSFWDILLFGSILIMGFYHLILFVLRRKEYYTLYFSIMCFLLSIRTLLMGEMLIYNLNPKIPLYVFIKLSLATLTFGLPIFIMYIYSFFPEDTPLWFVRLSQIVGFIFTAIDIAVPNIIYNYFHLTFQICSVIIVIITLIILSKAAYLKRDASLVFLAATWLIVLIIINDTLNGYGILKTGYYLSIGQVLFIFVQSFMLFKKLVKQEEQLLRSELRMLQAQIKPHFLFNALNTIISVSRFSPAKSEELLLYLSDYLRCGFSFKNDEEFVDFETEILHVKSYLAIEMARFSNKLKVVFDIDDNIDCRVPPFILQPIVENAVRHGILPRKNGGTVKLTAKQKDGMLDIEIEDDGIGIPEEKLNSILKGTDKSSGIGVYNVKNRIQKIYKNQVEIKSIVNEGTKVSMIIPISNGRM